MITPNPNKVFDALRLEDGDDQRVRLESFREMSEFRHPISPTPRTPESVDSFGLENSVRSPRRKLGQHVVIVEEPHVIIENLWQNGRVSSSARNNFSGNHFDNRQVFDTDRPRTNENSVNNKHSVNAPNRNDSEPPGNPAAMYQDRRNRRNFRRFSDGNHKIPDESQNTEFEENDQLVQIESEQLDRILHHGEVWLDALQDIVLVHPKCFSFNFELRSITDTRLQYSLIRHRSDRRTSSYRVYQHVWERNKAVLGEHVATISSTNHFGGLWFPCMKYEISDRTIECPPGRVLAQSKLSNPQTGAPYVYSAQIATLDGQFTNVFQHRVFQCGSRTFRHQTGEELARMECFLFCNCLISNSSNGIRITFSPGCQTIDKLILIDFAMVLLENSCSSPRQWIYLAGAFFIPCFIAALVLMIVYLVLHSFTYPPEY